MSIPEYRLVMRQGPTPGLEFELSKSELTIGRDVINDIVINDAEVSRKHVRLLLDSGRYRIEDLGSTNGTFINGKRLVGPHILAIGEQINLGENVLIVYESAQFDPDATMVGITANESVLPVRPSGLPPAPLPAYSPEPAQPYSAVPVPPFVSDVPNQPKATENYPQYSAQYVGQVPLGPEVDIISPEPVLRRKKPVNQWLLAGCGCLVLVILFFLAIWVFIDQPWIPVEQGGGLYCDQPFVIIFRAFGYCP